MVMTHIINVPECTYMLIKWCHSTYIWSSDQICFGSKLICLLQDACSLGITNSVHVYPSSTFLTSWQFDCVLVRTAGLVWFDWVSSWIPEAAKLHHSFVCLSLSLHTDHSVRSNQFIILLYKCIFYIRHFKYSYHQINGMLMISCTSLFTHIGNFINR